MKHVGKLDIVDIVRQPADEPGILPSLDPRANEFTYWHGISLSNEHRVTSCEDCASSFFLPQNS